MESFVNGGVNDTRFRFRVDSSTVPRDVEAASLVDGVVVITDTGTPAQIGDLFRAQEGPLQYQEIPVIAVTTNTFTIATTTLPVVTDEFYLLRSTSQRVDESGSQVIVSTSGPIAFVLDGNNVEVEEDTGTPANSLPLPVKVLNGSGLELDFATAAKQDAQTALLTTIDADTSALAGTVSGSEVQVDIVSSALPTGASTLAEQQAQTALLTTIDADTSALAGTVSGNEVQVDVVSSALPTGAATLAEQQTQSTSLATLAGTVAGTEVQVDIVSSALPTGAATLAEQQSQTTLLGTIDADTSALAGTVSGTEVQVDVVAALPAGTNNIGDVDVASLPVSFNAGNSDATTQRVVIASDQPALPSTKGRTVVTTVRNDYTSTAVTSGAWVELISSTSATVNKIEIFDSSGQTLELGTGAALSEARLILVFPGGNGPVDVTIPSGTRVAIRAVSATANVGEIDINLYS